MDPISGASPSFKRAFASLGQPDFGMARDCIGAANVRRAPLPTNLMANQSVSGRGGANPIREDLKKTTNAGSGDNTAGGSHSGSSADKSDEKIGAGGQSSRLEPSAAPVRPEGRLQPWNDRQRTAAIEYMDDLLGNQRFSALREKSCRGLELNQLEDLALVVFTASELGSDKEVPDGVRKAIDDFVKTAEKRFKNRTKNYSTGFHSQICGRKTGKEFLAANQAVVGWVRENLSEIFERHHVAVGQDVMRNTIMKSLGKPSTEWKMDCDAWELACRQFKDRMAAPQERWALETLRKNVFADMKVGSIANALRMVGCLENHIRPLSGKSHDNQAPPGEDQLTRPPFAGEAPPVDKGAGDLLRGADRGGPRFNDWRGNFSPTYTYEPKIEVPLGEAIKEAMIPVMEIIKLVGGILDDKPFPRNGAPSSGVDERMKKRDVKHSVDSSETSDDSDPGYESDDLSNRDGEARSKAESMVEAGKNSTVDGAAPLPPPMPFPQNPVLTERVRKSAAQKSNDHVVDMQRRVAAELRSTEFGIPDKSSLQERRMAAIGKLESKHIAKVQERESGGSLKGPGESAGVPQRHVSTADSVLSVAPATGGPSVVINKPVVTTVGGNRNGTNSGSTGGIAVS